MCKRCGDEGGVNKNNLCKPCNRTYQVEWNYSLGLGGLQRLVESQGGLCGACQLPLSATKRIAVDHDHSCCPGKKSCGKCVRGVLHQKCNLAIGVFEDSPELLRRAITYLESRGSIILRDGAVA